MFRSYRRPTRHGRRAESPSRYFDMSTTQPPKPKRRFRFTLKTLLIVVTLFTVGVGWIGSRLYRARENRARVAAGVDAVVESTTVAEIEKLGGTVSYGYEQLRPPTWLERRFADPGNADDPVIVYTVTKVGFLDDAIATDACLKLLKGISGLQSLIATGPGITDAGLEHLAGLESLVYLDLRDTNVTDATLERLKGLTDLQYLLLEGTRVTDAGLKHLMGLTNLQSLSLNKTSITDAGLEHLAGLESLRHLVLWETNVTDEGVEKLQQALPNCYQIEHGDL